MNDLDDLKQELHVIQDCIVDTLAALRALGTNDTLQRLSLKTIHDYLCRDAQTVSDKIKALEGLR